MLALLRRAAAILAVIIAVAFALSPHAATAAHSEGVIQPHIAAQHHLCEGDGCASDPATTCCGYAHCVAGLSQLVDETLLIVERDPGISSVTDFAKPATIRRLDRPPKLPDLCS